MRLETWAEHTICPDLIEKGGWVLDAGSLRHDFQNEAIKHELCVAAIDPNPSPLSWCYALVGKNNPKLFWHPEHDAAASYVNKVDSPTATTIASITIQKVMDIIGINKFEIVKLDIEGCELDVLQNWPGLVSKQISIEFHAHNWHGEGNYSQLETEAIKYISQWYTPVQHEKSCRHCLSIPNYWDSLFIQKDLVI